MRHLTGCWVLSILLAGCEARQPTATSAPARLPLGRNAYQVWDGAVDAGDALPGLTLDGRRWRVRTAAVADSTHFFTFTNRADKSRPLGIERGPQVSYAFQLLDEAGHPRFTKQLRKADFLAQADGGLVAVAGASPPSFLGYWPAHQALAFDVCFARDGTDDEQFVLLLLDARTGRLLHLAPGQEALNSSNCPPTLTANGQTLVAGNKLIGANGQVVSLARPRLSVAATRVLNDSTFLVIYETGPLNERAPTHQAHLLSRQGQTIRQFSFHGSEDCGSGFRLAHEFLPATQTHYLFDDAARAFTLVPRANPAAMQQVPVAWLTVFEAPRRAAEVELKFLPNCGPSASLYVDTLTRQLRCAFTPDP